MLRSADCRSFTRRCIVPALLSLSLAADSEPSITMGKPDKKQPKLQFELQNAHEDGVVAHNACPDSTGPEMGREVCQILTIMQLSLTKINGKIDVLSYRMDRMSEHIDEHAEHLDMVGRCVAWKRSRSLPL
ncbi:hypothetical protein NDU88_005053 [Pleurodeles waltl]|uniref:Uncharacterized protein n=1 Tax=Pleurodeles waltl TaxID=8319 RepID=A0AAV7QDR4_PLEWA|nr:hypothetical protein NDU88_005053 [Pleurodeles waltl]